MGGIYNVVGIRDVPDAGIRAGLFRNCNELLLFFEEQLADARIDDFCLVSV